MATVSRRKLKASELEAEITKRLAGQPDCTAIVQVYVKPTGLEYPEETWTDNLVSRRPAVPRSHPKTTAMQAVLKEMRQEFDSLPD